MNRMNIAMVVGLLLGVGAAAQSQPPAQTSTLASAPANTQNVQTKFELASGAAFNAELDSTLDSKKAKPGDPVKAKTLDPLESNGETVVPKGTLLMGHVSEATVREKGQAESSLGIVFDKAILKDGQEMPLKVAIQAMASEAAGEPQTAPVAGGNMGMGGGAPGSGMGGGQPARGGGMGMGNPAPNVGNMGGGNMNTIPQAPASAPGNVEAASKGAVGGVNAAGELTPNSRGVFGLHGLQLNPAANGTQGSVITSREKHVRLDKGTRMLLVAQTNTSTGQAAQR